ncbi:Nucleotide Sugar TransPorter family [Aphelenchoides besseyi]|nr:Nucleotide Sugar TransPorter family [Aphelenchoides besseyi]
MSNNELTGNGPNQTIVSCESSDDDSDVPFLENLDALVNDIEEKHDVSRWPFVENLSLVVFTFLQVISPILVRLAHRHHSSKNEESFLGSTTVFVTEITKVSLCCLIIPLHHRSLKKLFILVWESFTVNIFETLKISIPALVYVIQNNLYYYALQRIDASLFALTYQLRILTTAVLMVIILGRRFTQWQWLALLLSLVGAIAVQLGSSTRTTGQSHTHESMDTSIQLAGLSAVLIMCFTNAFGGVYLEAVLKKSEDDLFIQNIRLSLISLPLAAITMGSDYEIIKRVGFFAGWNVYVYIIVISAAFGGVVVSAVIKFADNAKKSLCQAVALGGTAGVSVLMGDSIFSIFLVVGVLLVGSSVILYANAPPYKKGQIASYEQRRLEIKTNLQNAYSRVPTAS